MYSFKTDRARNVKRGKQIFVNLWLGNNGNLDIYVPQK